MSILSVQNLVKQFVEKNNFSLFNRKKITTAIDNISFNLHENEICALLGANGAGKTTIIHMLLNILTPTSGSIIYFGKNLFTHRSEVLKDVSYASSYLKLPYKLTVEENLDIYGRIYGLTHEQRKEKIKKYLTFFDLWHYRNKESGTLSSGQLMKVMLSKAFLISPKIVLLDEPTASLDPETTYCLRQFILQEQREHGISMLITSHNMHEIADMCSRVLVIQDGKIIDDSSPENLIKNIKYLRIFVETNDITKIEKYALSNNLIYKIEKNGVTLVINKNMQDDLTKKLHESNISYKSLHVHDLSLEDYFLIMAKQKSGEK